MLGVDCLHLAFLWPRRGVSAHPENHESQRLRYIPFFRGHRDDSARVSCQRRRTRAGHSYRRSNRRSARGAAWSCRCAGNVCRAPTSFPQAASSGGDRKTARRVISAGIGAAGLRIASAGHRLGRTALSLHDASALSRGGLSRAVVSIARVFLRPEPSIDSRRARVRQRSACARLAFLGRRVGCPGHAAPRAIVDRRRMALASRAGVRAHSGNILANYRGRRSRHLDVRVRSAVPAGNLASARQFVFERHCPSRRARRRDCRNKIHGAYFCHRVARRVSGRVSLHRSQFASEELALLCLRHRRWYLAVYA